MIWIKHRSSSWVGCRYVGEGGSESWERGGKEEREK